jgi:hypothetical protein
MSPNLTEVLPGDPMPTFLERYLKGECTEVWADLIGLGDQVRQKPILGDAEDVAQETMRRARQNLEVLVPRLAAVGYRFAAPALERRLEKVTKILAEPKWNSYVLKQRELAVAKGTAPASILDPAMNPVPEARLIPYRNEKAALEAELERMRTMPPLNNPRVYYEPERQTKTYLKDMEKVAKGPIPLSLRAWYQQVGYVSFMGSHEVLNPEGSAIADPLVINSVDEISKSLGVGRQGDKITLIVSPNDLRKADVSSPIRYSVTIPNAAADWPFEKEWRGTYFVDYLRRAFQWAGFPGWERDPNPPRETISKLTEGLLPL